MNSPLRILVAEDEPSMAMVIRNRLGKLREYFPLATIEDYLTIEEAAERLKRTPYIDVLILDLSFPTSSFEETIARLDEFGTHSAVVLVTGRKRDEVQEMVGNRVIEVVEKGPEIFDGTLFEAMYRALFARRNKVIEEELSRVDRILETFNSIPNGLRQGILPA